MLGRDYEDQDCAIAAALEVVGERWTLLIVRDAMLGVRRFEDFQARLGVSRTVLAGRLEDLVERGVLERRLYQHRPDRHEYVLTDRGLDLWPVLVSLSQWGGEHRMDGKPPRRFYDGRTGEPVRAEVRAGGSGADLRPDQVRTATRPGAEVSGTERLSDEVRDALAEDREVLAPVRS